MTHSKSVTNKTSSDSELMERVARIYETTLAFDAWNAFSDTMTYILLIYMLWFIWVGCVNCLFDGIHMLLCVCSIDMRVRQFN